MSNCIGRFFSNNKIAPPPPPVEADEKYIVYILYASQEVIEKATAELNNQLNDIKMQNNVIEMQNINPKNADPNDLTNAMIDDVISVNDAETGSNPEADPNELADAMNDDVDSNTDTNSDSGNYGWASDGYVWVRNSNLAIEENFMV